MSDAVADPSEEIKKPSKLPLIFSLLAVLIGGGGGFFAAYSGLIMGDESQAVDVDATVTPGDLPDVTFVPVDPMTVSLGPGANNRHLRFRTHLEVPSQYASDVETLLPRVIDVLNGYLRALEISDLENASAMARLRAQMLRRVQIVTGPGRVNDLLIMEFVLN